MKKKIQVRFNWKARLKWINENLHMLVYILCNKHVQQYSIYILSRLLLLIKAQLDKGVNTSLGKAGAFLK